MTTATAPTAGPQAPGARSQPAERRLVRAVALAVLLQWIGAAAILPLLPEYLQRRGASLAVVGGVMAAYFVGALALQFPAGRLADRIGHRKVMLGGLVCFAAASVAFALPLGPLADIVLRALQGAGAGAAMVAGLAMVARAVPLPRRGRAVAFIYGGQLAGFAIGPLAGAVAGVGDMEVLFVGTAGIALAACIPVLLTGSIGPPHESAGLEREAPRTRGLPKLNHALVGAVITAAAIGLPTGVYEACWTLLLELRHAHDWAIALSWTLFAVLFIAMSRPGGWLADHLDRRRLAVAALAWSTGFCALYPFLHSVELLVVLGSLEALGFAVGLPSAQSLLTQGSEPSALGRVQGLFSTSETGATAIGAACGGTLFAVAPFVPFVSGAFLSLVLLSVVIVVWAGVPGPVSALGPRHDAGRGAAPPSVPGIGH